MKQIIAIGLILLIPALALGDRYYAGENYYWGKEGKTRNFKKAAFWYRYAGMREGNADGKAMIADMYHLGLGVTVNTKKAFTLAEESSKEGSLFGKFLLAKFYIKGIGTKRDKSKGETILTAIKAQIREKADAGEALFEHGMGWMNGNVASMKSNPTEAIYWLQKSATRGYTASQYDLGLLYLENGQTQNFGEALKWFKMAAELNDPTGQAGLGSAYMKGQGVEKDDRTALRWLKKAAVQGSPVGQYLLATMYRNGRGVETNQRRARSWYEKAANQNYLSAQYMMGVLYRRGDGVEDKDLRKAFQWFKMAGEQSHELSQYQVGFMYKRGLGVEKNNKEAVTWFCKAQANGYGKSNERRQKNLQMHLEDAGGKCPAP